MGFKGITDTQISEELKKRSGIARPGPKEFLLDFMTTVGAASLGMPVPIISRTPIKSVGNYKAARRYDSRILRKVERWLLDKGKRPSAPPTVFRGIPKGSVPQVGKQYTHGTPWKSTAARGGKGAFGDPRSYDVYQHASSPDTLFYRGGSLAGDPLEFGKIMSAQGMTWDKILDKGKRLYKRNLARIKGSDFYDDYSKSYQAKEAADQIRRASFETDITNKPGIWSQKVVPRELRTEVPKLRSNEDLKEIINKARKAGIPEAQVAELPESLILGSSWEYGPPKIPKKPKGLR
jgi:hypothetical protein